MVGFLRLFLATLVALAHVDVPLFGYHLGVPAVVVFYVLAGYVVALQWRGLSQAGGWPAKAIAFYRDRALRLFPAYYAALIIAAGVVLLVGPSSYFLSDGPSLSCAIGNITVVPINYFQLNGLDRCSLIPVAWSLGLEMQFYLLVPLLLDRRALLVGLGLCSLVVYVAAGIGAVPTDMWGYRLLPGTLFIFLFGVRLGHCQSEGRLAQMHWIGGLVSGAALLWTLTVAFGPQAQTDFAFETGLGLAAAAPLLLLALRFQRSAVDDVAGRVAYPLFLIHFPVLWLLQSWGISAATPLGLFVYIALALLAALALALAVDAPLANFRRRLRKRSVVIPAPIA